MDKTEYYEWVPAGLLVKGLFAMVIAIVTIVSFAVFLFSDKPLIENLSAISFSWGTLAILLFIYWNYRGLRIQIKDNMLFLDYGLFNKKSFLLSEIVSCKKTKSFGRYLGIGVRYRLDRSMAYTTSFEDAVEITPKEGRILVFSSKNPDKVCEIIGYQDQRTIIF